MSDIFSRSTKAEFKTITDPGIIIKFALDKPQTTDNVKVLLPSGEELCGVVNLQVNYNPNECNGIPTATLTILNPKIVIE